MENTGRGKSVRGVSGQGSQGFQTVSGPVCCCILKNEDVAIANSFIFHVVTVLRKEVQRVQPVKEI